jgi:ferrochelatase
MSDARYGVLLINVGTPDAPTPGPVRRYLREFLSDPRIIDINPIGRWLLLNLIVLPFRPQKSAAAYAKIWTDAGSPLRIHGEALAAGLSARLPQAEVVLGMRYGSPSIADGLEALRQRGVDRIVVFPLFPQYASASTGSALECVYGEVARRWNTPSISVVPPFYDDPAFIEPFLESGRAALAEFDADHTLFSFHGLPQRHMRKSDETGAHCLAVDDCCAALCEANRNCYSAQCYATARALAGGLGLADGAYTVTFQSRLGRTPWLRPYTDIVLPELAAAGKKRLAVFCPAFVADCLETLEEIGMRADADYRAAGGEALCLVPCPNAAQAWIEGAARLVRAAAYGPRSSALLESESV